MSLGMLPFLSNLTRDEWNQSILRVILIFIYIFSGCAADLENKDPEVRVAAVRKLTDQSLLAKMALEDKDKMIILKGSVSVTVVVLYSICHRLKFSQR
jgi:hypothetical protein